MPTVCLNIDVDDLQKGIAFYAAAVGLTPVRRLGDFAVELSGAQAPVFLLQKAPATPAFAYEELESLSNHWNSSARHQAEVERGTASCRCRRPVGIRL